MGQNVFDLRRKTVIAPGKSMIDIRDANGNLFGHCSVDGELVDLGSEVFVILQRQGYDPSIWRRFTRIELSAHNMNRRFVGRISLPMEGGEVFAHPLHGQVFAFFTDHSYRDLVGSSGMFYVQIGIDAMTSDYFRIEVRDILFDD